MVLGILSHLGNLARDPNVENVATGQRAFPSDFSNKLQAPHKHGTQGGALYEDYDPSI